MRPSLSLLFAFTLTSSLLAATHRVPQDHPTIQAAIVASQPGELIVVAPGRYQERIRLKPGITVRSEGENARGDRGLKRAEATILDGSGVEDKQPGVTMADGSTLDGFTVTNVGKYDDAVWMKHFETRGEELGDEEGAVQAEGTTPAISIQGVTCTVRHCIVHHNGDVGIGVLGQANTLTVPLILQNLVYRNMGGGIGAAEGGDAIIRGNTCQENLRAGIGCRQSNPIVVGNSCSGNVRAGIGCREGARPVIRGNECFQNRRAGIGIRMEGTAPVVEDNTCHENAMSGIGCRDGAAPTLRNNTCRANEMAGIGVQGKAVAFIQGNRCLENKLVAIGITRESTATILDNELARTGGAPPLIAVNEGSTAVISDNRLRGGGVAAILVQGTVTIRHNKFAGLSDKQGNAIWVRENSAATIADNQFEGYRAAVNAQKATVAITGNSIQGFQGTAILVKDSTRPAHVYENTGSSTDPKAKLADVQGPAGIVERNELN